MRGYKFEFLNAPCAEASANFQIFKLEFKLKCRLKNVALIHELYSVLKLSTMSDDAMMLENIQYTRLNEI